jgi:hypothetical protein
MFSVHISDDAKDSRGHDGGLDGTVTCPAIFGPPEA